MEVSAPIRLNRLSAPLGERNAILKACARAHFVKDFPGPLSIKSVTSGTVAWKCEGRSLVIGPDSFLILNDGEPYSLDIDSPTPVATFCVFFQRGFVESVRGSMERNAIDLEPTALDMDARESSPALFLPRLHARDGVIVPRMHAIADAPAVTQLWLDQQFLALASGVLLLDAELRRRIRLLPASRPATREELFRRVRRGQEFIHASAADDIDLAAIARQACLSPYHFHRAFTRMFGQSPHRYRNSLRLAQAHRLLRLTEMTVTDICAATGFESLASFSSLFRRQFGAPPSALRRPDVAARKLASFDKPRASGPVILRS